MKKLLIPSEADVDLIPVLKKALDKLPEKIGIVTTAQHLNRLDEAKQFLEKNNKEVFIGGQVLGCNTSNAEKLSEKSECILFIGSGRFHPLGIEKAGRIITANPFTGEVKEISTEDIEKIRKRRKGALAKFFASEKIGVLVSVKKGQSADFDRNKLQDKCPEKKFYYFLAETLNKEDLESFPFVECWVNTMCPRIAYEDLFDKPVVNLEDI